MSNILWEVAPILLVPKLNCFHLGVVAHICDPRTREAEVGRLP